MAASTNLTPAQRVERARNAGLARTSLDHHVAKVVDAAGELTADQLDRLRSLLSPQGAR